MFKKIIIIIFFLIYQLYCASPGQNLVDRRYSKKRVTGKNNYYSAQENFNWDRDTENDDYFDENSNSLEYDENRVNKYNDYKKSRDFYNNRTVDRGSRSNSREYRVKEDSLRYRKIKRIKKRNSQYNYDEYQQKINYNKSLQRQPIRKVPELSKQIDYKIYTVKKGDSLYKISRRFNIEVQRICSINDIKNKRLIYKGMKLKIPSDSKYIVKKSNNKKRAPQFIWPVKKVFSIKRDGLDGVRSIGIIIIGNYGAMVRSSASGVVKKIGSMRGFGQYVVIKNNNRYITVYSNLKNINVQEGEAVAFGSIIGQISSGDNKLHFQINHAGKPEDPIKFLPKI